MIDLARTQCPACGGRLAQLQPTGIDCTGCGRRFPIIDDIPVLKLDIASDTALDLDEYEASKPPDPKKIERMFAMYRDAMRRHGIDGGACLEIGSGAGNLTLQLVAQAAFAEIHCSDISARFLARLRTKAANDERLHYWLFDAARLPFRSGSMDAVFAQSVLHHILDYEATLADVFRVLRPGGIAMFGEPVMDSRALTAFLAGIILALEQQTGRGGWAAHELAILGNIRRAVPRIGVQMRERRAELAAQEDKHLFAIGDLRQLGHDIGFQVAEYRNAFNPARIGHDHKNTMTTLLARHGVPAERLAPYQFVFEELSDTYGAAMGITAASNFGYFVFRKQAPATGT